MIRHRGVCCTELAARRTDGTGRRWGRGEGGLEARLPARNIRSLNARMGERIEPSAASKSHVRYRPLLSVSHVKDIHITCALLTLLSFLRPGFVCASREKTRRKIALTSPWHWLLCNIVLEAPRASAQRHATIRANNPFDATHLLQEYLAERCTCSGLAARRGQNALALGI